MAALWRAYNSGRGAKPPAWPGAQRGKNRLKLKGKPLSLITFPPTELMHYADGHG